MEFSQKLQKLRQQQGLTQEELASALFVSRPAVSKWESGRGYPNIDSLVAIARFFGITVDELLSGEELLTVAREETRETENRIRDLVFGLMDCSTAMFFFLPFFGQETGETIQAVSLIALTEAGIYTKFVYFAWLAGMILLGILTLALQNFHFPFPDRNRYRLSLIWQAIGAAVFMICRQPYPAIFLFVFLIIKVLMLPKQQ